MKEKKSISYLPERRTFVNISFNLPSFYYQTEEKSQKAKTMICKDGPKSTSVKSIQSIPHFETSISELFLHQTECWAKCIGPGLILTKLGIPFSDLFVHYMPATIFDLKFLFSLNSVNSLSVMEQRVANHCQCKYNCALFWTVPIYDGEANLVAAERRKRKKESFLWNWHSREHTHGFEIYHVPRVYLFVVCSGLH